MADGIGTRIGLLLKKSKFTQKELAAMVGVTEAAMSRYLKNEREPRIEVVANIATALNTTTDYLISGTDENNFDYNSIRNLVARGNKTLTGAEKSELIRLLLAND